MKKIGRQWHTKDWNTDQKCCVIYLIFLFLYSFSIEFMNANKCHMICFFFRSSLWLKFMFIITIHIIIIIIILKKKTQGVKDTWNKHKKKSSNEFCRLVEWKRENKIFISSICNGCKTKWSSLKNIKRKIQSSSPLSWKKNNFFWKRSRIKKYPTIYRQCE